MNQSIMNILFGRVEVTVTEHSGSILKNIQIIALLIAGKISLM